MISNKKNIVYTLVFLIVVYFIDYVFPLPFFSYAIIFSISVYLASKLETADKGSIITSDSEKIKLELQQTLIKIKHSISSIEGLAVELETKTLELSEKEVHTKKLDKEIEKKLGEYENWKSLSEEEKKFFLLEVNKTFNKKSWLNWTSVIVGSILLNLIGNVCWALLGSPTKANLFETLKQFIHFNP